MAEKNNYSGKWSMNEHNLFLEAYFLFGHNWRLVQQYVKTRNLTQIRCHWQKLFRKVKLNINKTQYKESKSINKALKEAFYNNFDRLNMEKILTLSKLHDINLFNRQKKIFDEIQSLINWNANQGNNDHAYFLTSSNSNERKESLNEQEQACDNFNSILSICSVLNKKRIFHIEKTHKKDKEQSDSSIEIIDNLAFIQLFKEEALYFKSSCLSNNDSKINTNSYQNSSLPSNIFRRPPLIKRYKPDKVGKVEIIYNHNDNIDHSSPFILQESPGQSFFRKNHHVFGELGNFESSVNTFKTDFEIKEQGESEKPMQN